MVSQNELEAQGFRIEEVTIPGYSPCDVLVQRVDGEVIAFARSSGRFWYPQKHRLFSLLTAGFGGVTGYHQGSSTRSEVSDPRVELYLARLIEGGWVIDQRPAIDRHGVRVVLDAPLVDLTLEDDERVKLDELGDLDELVLQGVAASGNWAAQRCLFNPNWSGLDKVGLQPFLTYWGFHGARVGQRWGSHLHWVTGSREVIQEYLI